MQATPLFRDKTKFHLMADPLMGGDYPMKALYQALAIAAMCLQEEASTRPLMSDVVTALEFLSGNKKELDAEDKDEDEDEEKAGEETFKSPPALQSFTSRLERAESHDTNGVRERD